MPPTSSAPATYTDLRALFINCTLKPSPQPSHTATLMSVSQAIMKKQGVVVEAVRALDYDLAPGVQPDMTEHGFERDDWPELYQKSPGCRHPRRSARRFGWANAPRCVRG